jgi:acetoin utilization deacetylase AcuC-like enzyme
MLVVTSDDHLAHHALELDSTNLVPSWETPTRVDSVRRAIESDHRSVDPHRLDESLLHAVHDDDYLAFMANVWDRWTAEEAGPAAMGVMWPARRFDQLRRPTSLRGLLGYHGFAADCSVVAGTWRAALASAAIAQTAAELVVGGERAAFALCRPPGHHATRDQFGGYCYLNNAAIAVEVLRRSGVERVGVLDIDYHHGNGTQDIFYERDDVFVCSIHADPTFEFPYFSGHAEETGGGAGAGYNRNEPLPAGTELREWLAAADRCLDALQAAGCGALVVSTGLDTFEADPISRFLLRTDDYPLIGARIAAAGLPTVFVFEGGYAVDALGDNVAGLLNGFEAVNS